MNPNKQMQSPAKKLFRFSFGVLALICCWAQICSAAGQSWTYPWTHPTINASLTINSVDINEMRTFINQKRNAVGLANYVWTDPILTAGMQIRAVHFQDLATAVTQIYNQIGSAQLSTYGLTTPSFPAFMADTSVKSTGLLQIRQALDNVMFCGDAICNGTEQCTGASHPDECSDCGTCP